MDYKTKVVTTLRELNRRGYPHKAAKLERRFKAGEPIPNTELDTILMTLNDGVIPERTVDQIDELHVPPRAGNKATRIAWATFAKSVANVEPDVIDSLTRNEIIELLERRNIIPTVKG